MRLQTSLPFSATSKCLLHFSMLFVLWSSILESSSSWRWQRLTTGRSGDLHIFWHLWVFFCEFSLEKFYPRITTHIKKLLGAFRRLSIIKLNMFNDRCLLSLGFFLKSFEISFRYFGSWEQLFIRLLFDITVYSIVNGIWPTFTIIFFWIVDKYFPVGIPCFFRNLAFFQSWRFSLMSFQRMFLKISGSH